MNRSIKRSPTTSLQTPACSLLMAVALLWSLVACTAEEPPPTKYDGVQLVDGPQWPDYGPGKNDMWVPPKDTGTPPKDGAFTEGGTLIDGSAGDFIKPDGPGNCKSPTGVSCKPTCTSKEVCTAAKSGTCTTTYFLSGPASNTKALLALALAFVDCWNKQASSDTLCSTLDGCAMTGTMSDGLIKSWVCKIAQVSDFPSAAKHKTAQSVFQCGTLDLFYRPDWKVKTIPSKERGTICLSYNSVSWLPDKIEVNNCSSYPPK